MSSHFKTIEGFMFPNYGVVGGIGEGVNPTAQVSPDQVLSPSDHGEVWEVVGDQPTPQTQYKNQGKQVGRHDLDDPEHDFDNIELHINNIIQTGRTM